MVFLMFKLKYQSYRQCHLRSKKTQKITLYIKYIVFCFRISILIVYSYFSITFNIPLCFHCNNYWRPRLSSDDNMATIVSINLFVVAFRTWSSPQVFFFPFFTFTKKRLAQQRTNTKDRYPFYIVFFLCNK